MTPGDDTHVPNQLLTKAAGLVGAKRAATFVLREGANSTYVLELMNFMPRGAGKDAGRARRVAAALQRFVIPCLADGLDRAIEVPEKAGPASRTYVLVFLAREQSEVRGVAVMEVACRSAADAERRLLSVQQAMGEAGGAAL
jgi:hypothetical protein